MFFSQWLLPSREEKKNECLCTMLLKDIRFDIGEKFEEQEKRRLLTVSDLHLTVNKQYGDLHLCLTEPLTLARQSEWKEETGIPLETDDERLQEFYQRYYKEVEDTLKVHFPYAIQIRHNVVVCLKETSKDKINIEYSIQFELSERVLPLSRKVKKSIIKFKNYVLTRP